ncbi:hypothetical protein BN132_1379 [Cronobacter turicensis 564]|nr:hypothetical protein BN132_1379 [Cronobacter turicensis 564]
MHRQLRLRVAKRGKRRDRRQLPAFQRQPRPAVDIAKAEFNDVAPQIRRDIGQRFDNIFTCCAVDFGQARKARVIT